MQTSSNREWRRWEESDLWRWDERKRREWAIAIVRSSHSRALQRRRAIARQSQQKCVLWALSHQHPRLPCPATHTSRI